MQREIVKELILRNAGPDAELAVNKADWGYPNERKYIIDAKWWQQWCDYTGF